MYKILIEDNFLVIIVDATLKEYIRHPIRDSTYNIIETEETLNPIIRFSGVSKDMLLQQGGSSDFRQSILLKPNGDPFATTAEVKDLLNPILFKVGGGNGNGVTTINYNGQVEIWDLYGHSGFQYNYTGGTLGYKLPDDSVYNNSYNLTNSFNSSTFQLDLSSFFVGGQIEIKIDIDFITTQPNQEILLTFRASVGHVNEWVGRIRNVTYKTVKQQGDYFLVKYPIEFQSDLDFPAQIEIYSDDNLTIIPKFQEQVTKTPVTAQFAKSNLITGDFFGGVSQVVYSDQYTTLYWDSITKQFYHQIPSTTPLGAWGWFDTSYKVLTQTLEFKNTSDISASAGIYYFTTGGVLNTSANATGFGAVIEATLTKESYLEGFPSYSIKGIVGNTNNVKFIIIKTN